MLTLCIMTWGWDVRTDCMKATTTEMLMLREVRVASNAEPLKASEGVPRKSEVPVCLAAKTGVERHNFSGN